MLSLLLDTGDLINTNSSASQTDRNLIGDVKAWSTKAAGSVVNAMDDAVDFVDEAIHNCGRSWESHNIAYWMIVLILLY